MNSVDEPLNAPTAYATEVARLLWPPPWAAPYVTRERALPGQVHRDAYLFPSEGRARLLVPVDVRASSCMLRRLGTGRTAAVAPIRSLLEHSVHSRAFALARWPRLRVTVNATGADSIEHHLSGCFGNEVRVGVLLGTRRVNQKPVLQVFDLEGRVRGYVKVGHNDLTNALVRGEAEALTILRTHATQSFRVPHVIHQGQWTGLEVLVISALVTDRDRVTRAARLSAMREVSLLAGKTSASVAESPFWDRVRHSVEALPVEPVGTRLRAVVRRIEAAHGADPVQFGGWHGDWGRWNMGMGAGVLKLWDWERYDPGVPIGFDGLHFAAQAVRPGNRNERRQEAAFLRSVPQTLTELSVPRAAHDVTLRLYLVEIAVRYADALTHGVTPALARRTSWVLSLLERLCEHPGDLYPEGRP